MTRTCLLALLFMLCFLTSCSPSVSPGDEPSDFMVTYRVDADYAMDTARLQDVRMSVQTMLEPVYPNATTAVSEVEGTGDEFLITIKMDRLPSTEEESRATDWILSSIKLSCATENVTAA